MIIKSKEELNVLKEGGKILSLILKDLKNYSKAGITTKELNERAMALILKYNAQPSFLNYRNFPAALCTSINEEVVHCLPSDRQLKNGDILSLDLGIWYPKENSLGKSLCLDAAITFGIGKISPLAQKLIKVTKKSLEIAISKIKAGKKTGDVGYIIQTYIEKNKFSVIRELAGHSLGKAVHEDPYIPNFGKEGEGEVLEEGMVLAIEPMAATGYWKVKLAADGFCFKMADNSLSAHFENTIVVTKKGAIILTNTNF